MLDFALNQVTMAASPLPAFLAAAEKLGCSGVELRNDLTRPTFDNLPPRDVCAMLGDHDLQLYALSQVYPCNRWSDSIATETQSLIDTAVGFGAQAISLIPCNDGSRLGETERLDDLKRGVEGVLPLLTDAGLTANLEPLGFSQASLQLKSEAVAVIHELGASENVKIAHDTFHHTISGETDLFPSETGIVHISGVATSALSLSELQDEHRILVDQDDRLENLGQISALISAGYTGPFSFECFAPALHAAPNLVSEIGRSIAFITAHLQERAA